MKVRLTGPDWQYCNPDTTGVYVGAEFEVTGEDEFLKSWTFRDREGTSWFAEKAPNGGWAGELVDESVPVEIDLDKLTEIVDRVERATNTGSRTHRQRLIAMAIADHLQGEWR